MTKKPSVGIIGGGITGLSAAYGLHRKGVDAVVYEKKAAAGGLIQSSKQDGWLVEHGPNTLMVRSQEVWDLLADLRLNTQTLEAGGKSKNRFIVKNQKPVPVPLSLSQFLKTSLLSGSAKLRLLKEPFVASSQQSDESIASFITRRLGREPLDYAVAPFVSGVYAGSPDNLSVKHTFSSLWELEQTYGNLIMGAVKTKRSGPGIKSALISFEDGMQALPQALAHWLGKALATDTEIQKLSPVSDGWMVKGRTPEGPFEQKHKALICTVPTYRLADLVPSLQNSPALARISKVPYVPLSIVALGFTRGQVGHPLDGFGMLIPEAEPFHTLGTLFSSSLFSNRAPKDHILLTSFIGGAQNPELAVSPKEKLISIVRDDLSRLLNIEGDPVFSRHIRWKHAIPQYEVNYDIRLNAMRQFEQQHPGLLLAGNFRQGVSVPDCISNGIKTANRVARFLSS